MMKPEPILIPCDRRPQVLLLGNGINRAFQSADSWDDLLRSIQTKTLTTEETEQLGAVPYPLRPVILTGGQLEANLPIIAGALTDLQPPEEEKELLRRFAQLPVDAILSTNYTYELEKSLIPGFKASVGRHSKYRKLAHDSGSKDNDRWLSTYFQPPENVPGIWHIHGEAARPDTMILGHYQYGKLLSWSQQHIPGLIRHYKGKQKGRKPLPIHSWLDWLLLGDVHIVGFGLDLSELDLWWLINCKMRNFSHTTITWYKSNITPGQQLLAEACGVKVVSDTPAGKDYPTYYRRLAEQLRITMDGR